MLKQYREEQERLRKQVDAGLALTEAHPLWQLPTGIESLLAHDAVTDELIYVVRPPAKDGFSLHRLDLRVGGEVPPEPRAGGIFVFPECEVDVMTLAVLEGQRIFVHFVTRQWRREDREHQVPKKMREKFLIEPPAPAPDILPVSLRVTPPELNQHPANVITRQACPHAAVRVVGRGARQMIVAIGFTPRIICIFSPETLTCVQRITVDAWVDDFLRVDEEPLIGWLRGENGNISLLISPNVRRPDTQTTTMPIYTIDLPTGAAAAKEEVTIAPDLMCDWEPLGREAGPERRIQLTDDGQGRGAGLVAQRRLSASGGIDVIVRTPLYIHDTTLPGCPIVAHLPLKDGIEYLQSDGFIWREPGVLVVLYADVHAHCMCLTQLYVTHVPWWQVVRHNLAVPAPFRAAVSALAFLRWHGEHHTQPVYDARLVHYHEDDGEDGGEGNGEEVMVIAADMSSLWSTLPLELFDHLIAVAWAEELRPRVLR